MMNFKDLKDKIDKIDIKCRSDKDWELFLPFNFKDSVQKIIDICREELLVNWHIIFTEPTEENPEPEIKMYWK